MIERDRVVVGCVRRFLRDEVEETGKEARRSATLDGI